MTSTRSRRAGVLVALAATALTGASLSGVAVANGTAHRSPSSHSAHGATRLATTLTISTARRSISQGGSDVVRGRLRSNGHRLAALRVVLQDRLTRTAHWTDVTGQVTNRHGRVAFPVSPTATTRYRLVFRGSPNFRPSHSGVRVVRVRSVALSINAAATSVEPGASDTISGVLTDSGTAVQGATVQLRAKPVGTRNQKFAVVGSTTSATDGSISFTVTPAGSTRYVLFSPKTDTRPAARSAVVTVWVRSPSSLSIRGQQRTKLFVVSGQLRGNGHALRSRKVTLLRRDAGTTTGFAAVSSKLTDKHGLVVFRRRPTVSTEFELRFAGGPRYDGCTSGVVTATVS